MDKQNCRLAKVWAFDTFSVVGADVLIWNETISIMPGKIKRIPCDSYRNTTADHMGLCKETRVLLLPGKREIKIGEQYKNGTGQNSGILSLRLKLGAAKRRGQLERNSCIAVSHLRNFRTGDPWIMFYLRMSLFLQWSLATGNDKSSSEEDKELEVSGCGGADVEWRWWKYCCISKAKLNWKKYRREIEETMLFWYVYSRAIVQRRIHLRVWTLVSIVEKGLISTGLVNIDVHQCLEWHYWPQCSWKQLVWSRLLDNFCLESFYLMQCKGALLGNAQIAVHLGQLSRPWLDEWLHAGPVEGKERRR